MTFEVNFVIIYPNTGKGRVTTMIAKKCCFAGHSSVNDDSLADRICLEVKRLVTECGVKLFQVGAYGDFDKYAAEAVRKAKEEYPHIILELVLPYLKKDGIPQNLYDSVIIANMPDNTPNRLKILKANEYMVNNCDYLICYVNNSFGGAAKTLEYANKKRKVLINLASVPKNQVGE